MPFLPVWRLQESQLLPTLLSRLCIYSFPILTTAEGEPDICLRPCCLLKDRSLKCRFGSSMSPLAVPRHTPNLYIVSHLPLLHMKCQGRLPGPTMPAVWNTSQEDPAIQRVDWTRLCLVRSVRHCLNILQIFAAIPLSQQAHLCFLKRSNDMV